MLGDTLSDTKLLTRTKAFIDVKQAYITELQVYLARAQGELAELQLTADGVHRQARTSRADFAGLGTQLEAGIAEATALLEPVKRMRIEEADVAQAHNMCCLLLGRELDYDVFTAQELDGPALLLLLDGDLVRLFDLQPVGHRQRLLYGLRKLALEQDFSVFDVDFDASVQALTAALQEQRVAPELVAKVMEAKLDCYTGATLTM